jgi:hypothetical protein
MENFNQGDVWVIEFNALCLNCGDECQGTGSCGVLVNWFEITFYRFLIQDVWEISRIAVFWVV